MSVSVSGKVTLGESFTNLVLHNPGTEYLHEGLLFLLVSLNWRSMDSVRRSVCVVSLLHCILLVLFVTLAQGLREVLMLQLLLSWVRRFFRGSHLLPQTEDRSNQTVANVSASNH